MQETHTERTSLECHDCETCGASVEHESHLVTHKKTDHVQNFQCKKCDSRLSEGENVIKHMENEHVSAIDFQKCNEILANKHIDEDQNDSLKDNVSNESSILKSFESVSEEDRFSHEEEYECNICDGEFIDYETLQHHNEIYHKISPHEKTFFNPSAR